jgi:hypothetical protein
MAWKTGRSRMIMATGAISGTVSRRVAYDTTRQYENDLEINFNCFGMTASAGPSSEGPASGSNWVVTASAMGGSGSTVSNSIPLPLVASSSFESTYTLDVSGSFSAQVFVEEWVETGSLSDPSTGIIDAPSRLTLVFYEQMRAGDTVTCTITSGSVSATSNFVLPSGFPLRITNYVCSASIGGYASNSTATGSLTLTAAGGAITGLYSGSSNGSTFDSTSGAAITLVPIPVSGGGTLAVRGSLQTQAAPNKSFALDGVIYAVDQPFMGGVDIQCSKFLSDPSPLIHGGATWSAAYAQRNKQVTVSLSSGATGTTSGTTIYTYSSSLNEFQALTATLDSAWCDASGDYITYDTSDESTPPVVTHHKLYDNTIWMHGWTFPGLTLTPAATLTLGTGAGTNLSFSPAKNLSGYRYLRVTVSVSAGSHPFSVQIGTKTWNQCLNPADHTQRIPLLATTTPQTFDIDLCDPTNDSSLSDLTDTRWPIADPTLDYSGGGGPAAVDGPMWGVGYCTLISLTAMDSGVSYSLGAVSQVRETDCKLHVLGSWRPRFETNMLSESPTATNMSGTTTEVKCRRFLMADTDGRQSLEYKDVSVSKVTGGVSGVITYLPYYVPLSELAFDPSPVAAYPAGQTPGWTGVCTAPAPDGSSNLRDGFLNSGSPAGWLWGGGLLYSGGAWTTGVGLSAAGGITMPAQVMFASVDWYPGIGDVFSLGGGGTGGAIILKAEKILQAQAHGIVLTGAHGPGLGKTVTLAETATPSSIAGSDSEHAPDGTYRTAGVPGLHGYKSGVGNSGIVQVDVRMATQSFVTRHLSRAALRTAAVLSYLSPSNLGLLTDHFQRVVASALGIVFVRSVSGTPYVHSGNLWDVGPLPVTTTATDKNPCLAADSRFLYCGWERAAGTYLARSGDNGKTWEAEVLAITGGTFPRIDADGSGRTINAALVSAGGSLYHIQGQFQGPGDAHFGATFTFIDETATALSVQSSGFDISFTRSGTNALILSALIAGEAATSEWVCYNVSGTNPSWKRIPTS